MTSADIGGQQVSAFAQPRRHVGQAEGLLAKTLRAWHEEGHLSGPAFAVHRGILRDAARAVDAARDASRIGECSDHTFARVNKMFLEAVQAFTATEVQSNDALDDLIASFSGPAVRDSP
jgi:hypothetical protein